MRGEGWHGWDAYAPFYDWENARTLGRRDVGFWRRLALTSGGRVLELGCGTGRISLPLARAGVDLVGVDRSAAMLARLHRHRTRSRLRDLTVVRADIRTLPFRSRSFGMVIAPYGMLQSLTSNRDLKRALTEISRVLQPGGLFGIDLVPDLPRWSAYRRQVRLRGRAGKGGMLTLVESVRQDRRRGLTVFDEEFVQRRGLDVTRRRFSLTFRTIPMRSMVARLDRAGLEVEAMLGDYRGGPWDTRADVWVILARKVPC